MTVEIVLYELAPTRSARARWALLEAGLEFESRGNEPGILHSEELRRIHPLGKLPAMLLDGEPLFESTAIVNAVADLVPERGLIASSGTAQRRQHDQWTAFALSELEAHAWMAELNTLDFVWPRERHLAGAVEQCRELYSRSLEALDRHLAGHEFLVADRFTAADINMSYAVNFGQEFGWLAGARHVEAYLERLFEQPHCTLTRVGP